MAKRVYATQLAPGMVLSSGFLVTSTVRHALDKPGMVRVFTQPEDEDTPDIVLMPNDESVPGGALPEGKVRVKFADGEVRDWNEDTRIKVTEQL